MSSQRQTMLRLYRAIRKHHRQHLPEQLRQLGDETLRHEWKQHKAADAAFVRTFHREWEQYLHVMRVQAQTAAAAGSLGRDLDQAQVAQLNDEQRAQLLQLREAAMQQKQQ